MAMPTPIANLRHAVFMSYAHDDNAGWNYFVSHFNTELNRGLKARLRDFDVPLNHFSEQNGPINGPLNEALQRSIRDSFAMMLFVHDGYVASPWCLQELKYFKEIFGADGFLERLYIVAMSKQAIKKLEARPDWKDLFPSANQVWVSFFQEDETDWPIPVYASNSRGKEAVVANDFWGAFVRVREDLVKKIRDVAENELTSLGYAAAVPKSIQAPPQGSHNGDQMPSQAAGGLKDLEVMVYIESEPGVSQYWEPLGQQVAVSWDSVVATDTTEPKLLLRPTGLPMHDLHDRPRLDDADGVILLWGEKAAESLLAQIALVEPKLSGPNLAPGLIAYLMEAGKQPAYPIPDTIHNWPVVRFATRRREGSATVVAEDFPKLAKYLHDVLRHKRHPG